MSKTTRLDEKTLSALAYRGYLHGRLAGSVTLTVPPTPSW